MSTTIEDPKLIVRDLLREGWDNSLVPVDLDDSDIHTGWYDDGKGFPQITVTSNEETPVGGGVTGYTGVAGDGSGPIQQRRGTVLVTVWAGSRESYEFRGLEQKQANEMAQVVEEILYGVSVEDLHSVAVTSRNRLVDEDENPTVHYEQLVITFNWTKRPN